MIRVERDEKIVNGKCRWRVQVAGVGVLEGFSRQPLLDACRALKSAGADPRQRAALYRPGHEEWDLRCMVSWGASKTIRESSKEGLQLRNYEPFKHVETQD